MDDDGAPSSAPGARLARLKDLRARMRDSSSANRNDVVAEQTQQRAASQRRSSAGSARKLAKAERMLDERDMRERGQDVERQRAMQYTLEENEAWEQKLADKERSRDKGAVDFQELAERSYLRQVAQLKPDMAAYAQQKEAAAQRAASAPRSSALTVQDARAGPLAAADAPHLSHGAAAYGTHRPSEGAVDRLVSHVNHEQDAIRRRSRRRAEDPDAEITYINEKNKHFNKKIKRYYDEHTKEIRDNLERGTAL
ncbi:SYF2 splicing factor [Malassezia sp. CBS 17886]|nr:SYF2 splicing factor [Malassezia sp. CBS 17886]